MGVYENDTRTAAQGTAFPTGVDSSLYGVNKFRASLFMFISNDYQKDRDWTDESGYNDDVSSSPAFASYDETADGSINHGSLIRTSSSPSSSFKGGKSTPNNTGNDAPPPEVMSRRVGITRPRLRLQRVSETVSVCAPTRQPETLVVSHLEFQGHKRYKNEVRARQQMRPERYAETCYVHINSTHKRYVSTTFLKPRLQDTAHAETVYQSPKTVSARYETVMNYCQPCGNDRWFKTCLQFQPKPDSSSVVRIPPSALHYDNISDNELQFGNT